MAQQRPQPASPSRASAPAAAPGPASTISLLSALIRHWWVVLSVVALAAGAAGLVSALQSPVYRASMKLVIGEGGGLLPPDLGGSVEPITQTMTSLLQSDVVARSVIEELRLQTTPEDLLEDVTVRGRPESAVIDVTYDTSDQQAAVPVLAGIGRVFVRLVDERFGGPGPDGSTSERPRLTVSVFDAAHLKPDPVAPRTIRNIILAGLIGLGVGAALAALRDRAVGRRLAPPG